MLHQLKKMKSTLPPLKGITQNLKREFEERKTDCSYKRVVFLPQASIPAAW